jgi:riboflavin synthase
VFTGLVETTARVRRVDPDGDGVRLEVETPLAAELEQGDSVAVNGVCLTAIEPASDRFKADVMAETLRRSSLGPLAAGDSVNLELPLRAGDRLGGHVVQGHVDGTGTVESAHDEGFARVVRIGAAPELLRYVVEKGSIAVDGVSLTVAEVDDDGFSVSLIPETLERTTLGQATPGRVVNLEVDVLAKYVEKLVAR